MVNRVERRIRILQSASKLFSDKRFDEVLMDDVASEAGVGKGTLYRYFGDKEELYFAVVFDGIAQLREQLRGETAMASDPLARLEATMRAIVTFLSRNRFFFRLMAIEDSKTEEGKSQYRQRWKEERGELMGLITDVLQSGAECGLFEIHHLNTEAQILLGMVRSTLRFNEDKLNADEIVEEILGIFLRGIQKQP